MERLTKAELKELKANLSKARESTKVQVVWKEKKAATTIKKEENLIMKVIRFFLY